MKNPPPSEPKVDSDHKSLFCALAIRNNVVLCEQLKQLSKTMPNAIDKQIQIALADVESHPDHWFLPIKRRILYEMLDPNKSILIHLQIRPWLDLYTFQYVLRLWEPIIHDPKNYWKDYYHVPAQMVSLLEGILYGTVDKESVSDLVYHWAEVQGLTGEMPESEFYNAWCVFKAGLKGLLYVLGHDAFSETSSFSEKTTQIDNTYGDTANFAAIAYAGGEWQPGLPLHEEERVLGSWNRDLDIVRGRRLQFWKWWLLEAIPKAYTQIKSLQ